MAAAVIQSALSPAIASLSNTSLKLSATPFKPFSPSNANPSSLSFSISRSFTHPQNQNSPSSVCFSFRLNVSQTKSKSPKRSCRLLAVCGLVDGNSEGYQGVESSDLEAGVTIDIKLPRRSLLVQFTCDKCGERTDRLINRLAYERGLVYVQCAGCEQYHKLVDNLGLVVEHDLRDVKTNTDQA